MMMSAGFCRKIVQTMTRHLSSHNQKLGAAQKLCFSFRRRVGFPKCYYGLLRNNFSYNYNCALYSWYSGGVMMTKSLKLSAIIRQKICQYSRPFICALTPLFGLHFLKTNMDVLAPLALKVAKCEALEHKLPEEHLTKLRHFQKQELYIISVLRSLHEVTHLCLRALHLICVFVPVLLVYPLSYISDKNFSRWLSLLYVVTEHSGATFVKLGQWASTRRDLFSKEFCDQFSMLHHHVKPHSWKHTQRTLKKAFGKNWREHLLIADGAKPVGSGCIAQVYKGYISSDCAPVQVVKELDEEKETNKAIFGEGIEICSFSDEDDKDGSISGSKINGDLTEELIPVAVKVLHPGIERKFDRDLKLMKTAAKCLTVLFPQLHWVNLNQCVQEFSITMKKQLDLRHESRCLQQFSKDFESSPNIRVPQPFTQFVRRNILVETFEEGVSMGDIVKDATQPYELKKEIARLGMDLLLKMIFVNNFVHADLHPGNLLVQNVEHFSCQKTAVLQVAALDMMVVNVKPVDDHPLKLVLLDSGITASLSAPDKLKFKEVFTAVVKGEGEAVADLFLAKSAVNYCSDKELFRKEMAAIVHRGRQNLLSISKIKIAELMNDVFSVLSRHKIQLESSFATIILAMAMLEGLGRSLDPNLDLLSKARPILTGV